MDTHDDPDPDLAFLQHIGDLHENQSLTTCQLDDKPCPTCRGARWLMMRGSGAGDPAPSATVIEAIAGAVAPCGACGLALH
jgi:hypothetical protein